MRKNNFKCLYKIVKKKYKNEKRDNGMIIYKKMIKSLLEILLNFT